ncbi:MAG: helix-turn-helix domain-containing protein [Pseudonocardiaceae bacterium]
MTTPEQLITIIPADVAVILLTRGGLGEYRKSHRGEHPRVDRVLIELTEAAIRWRELTDNGQNRAPNTDTGPSSELLTTRQAADLARTSDRTIRRLIAAGRIPAARAGRACLIRRDELDHHTRR